ncbi:hypothetical protein [Streptomyces sioyaensis]|uniref:hypothetical protein n=1 Tax=Streptomyces sioyaensis TaxID=67364 RepID=UPI0036E6A62B
MHTASDRVRAFKTGPQADWFNHFNVHDQADHFIPWENPDAWGERPAPHLPTAAGPERPYGLA